MSGRENAIRPFSSANKKTAIKIVRSGLNIQFYPDANVVELVEKQIARQKERELER